MTKIVKNNVFFRNRSKKEYEIIFDIIKYLKFNFKIEKADNFKNPNYVIKDDLLNEIKLAIDFGKSMKYLLSDTKLMAIINLTFNDDPNFYLSRITLLNKDNEKCSKPVFKNLKRIFDLQPINDENQDQQELNRLNLNGNFGEYKFVRIIYL